ncbi:MAG: IS110 family transposase [Flavobacteriales bacterium]|nr:IS110 family transposase [Flavobacteriales bacterium]
MRSRARQAHITDLNRYMDRQLGTEFDASTSDDARGPTRGPWDALILAEIRTHPETERQYDLLRTIPGVGPRIAAYLVACTDGFARFNTPRQLSCHAGVAPFERSSGSSVRAAPGRIKLISRSRPCCTCPRW